MIKEKNTYRTLFILTLLILSVLIVIVIYILAIKPTIQGYVVQKQIEASNYTSNYIIGTIVNQVQQKGYIQLTYANQSVILIQYNPQAQPNK